MKIGHSYGKISGWGFQDVYGIAHRYPDEEGRGSDEGESWIVKTAPGDNTTVVWTCMYKLVPFTGIWRSREDKVYVAEIGGTILHGPLEPGEVWPEKQVGMTVGGIWGLDDHHVYVWGFDSKTPAMARWDGTEWKKIESPDFQIIDVHGIAPDLLVAVGTQGEISRWDGSHWIAVDSGTRKSLSSVFVASQDEMYACGHDGVLLQGSVHGWQEILDGDVQMPCVAKWRDEVYVGTYGDLGLCKLEGGSLVSFKPKVQAMAIDVRENLVVGTTGAIAGTYNGVNYAGTFVQGFIDATAQFTPLW